MSEVKGINEDGHDLGLSSFSEERQNINVGKRIYCNSAVNINNIVAVGFDMDYTLAQYKADTFESLTYQGTVEKLVRNLGYPKELLEWSFDWTYMVRGLVLDKKRGNILKMDRHKYVKIAYHGFRLVSKDEKVATYGNTYVKEAFYGPNYAHIDTFFSLAEAYLFAQLVDYKDSNPGQISEVKDYARIYADVRSAVDMCHRDGTLKEMVAKDPKKAVTAGKKSEQTGNRIKNKQHQNVGCNSAAQEGMKTKGNAVNILKNQGSAKDINKASTSGVKKGGSGFNFGRAIQGVSSSKTQQNYKPKVNTKQPEIAVSNRFSVLDLTASVRANDLVAEPMDLYPIDNGNIEVCTTNNQNTFDPGRVLPRCNATNDSNVNLDGSAPNAIIYPDSEYTEVDYDTREEQRRTIRRAIVKFKCVRAEDTKNWSSGEWEYFWDQCDSLGLDRNFVIEDVGQDTSGSAKFLTNQMKGVFEIIQTKMKNFLIEARTINSSSSLSVDWLQYFDFVITGRWKLINTDNGTPLAQVGGPAVDLPDQIPNKHCKVFQGGNVSHLHKLLNVGSSSQVLYVGDHIFGDILRSKKALGWRTMFVVPELEKEARILSSSWETQKKLKLLRGERDKIEDQVHHLKWYLEHEDIDTSEKEKLTAKLELLEGYRARVRADHQDAQRSFHQQVERFACLYTSEVGNPGLYSPNKCYRPAENFMAHESNFLSL